MAIVTTPKRGPILATLILGSFGIGMTEFIVMGLLPNIAQSMLATQWAASPEDAIAQAGWVITLYALGAVIGAPLIAGSVARFPRHKVLLVLALAFAVANLLSFIAPTFELLAASRFLAGLPHGAYFGIGALVAADALGPGRQAKGASMVLIGLTLANVVGVPLGTYLGQAFGWRTAFAVVLVVFLAASVAIPLTLPVSAGDPTRTLRSELRVFRKPQIWFTLGVGTIGFGGLFSVYSYIAPLVTEVAGAPESAIAIILLLLGIGMTLGNLAGGHFADINLRGTLYGGLVAISLAQIALALTSQWVIAVGCFAFTVGFFSSTLAPTIQARLVQVSANNQSIAGALNHSALNSGNAMGAALGGAAISAGFGFVAPVWVGAAMALIGLLIAFTSFAAEDRRARVNEATPSAPRPRDR